MNIFMRRFGVTAFATVMSCVPALAQWSPSVVGTWICIEPSQYGGSCIEQWGIIGGGFHSTEAVCDGGISMQYSGQWYLQGATFSWNYYGQACDSMGRCQQLGNNGLSVFVTMSDGVWTIGSATCVSTAAKKKPWYNKLMDRAPDAVEHARKMIEDKIDDFKRDGRAARWGERLERFLRALK